MIAIASLLVVVLISLLVTRVASIALTATGMSREMARFQARSALVVGLTVLVGLARSRWVDRRATPPIARLLSRFTDLETRDYAGLLELENGYWVSELVVERGRLEAGRTLGDLRLRDEGVVVLGVSGRSGWIGAPSGATCVEPGETFVLSGLEEAVCELDVRKRGVSGEAAHARAVSDRR